MMTVPPLHSPFPFIENLRSPSHNALQRIRLPQWASGTDINRSSLKLNRRLPAVSPKKKTTPSLSHLLNDTNCSVGPLVGSKRTQDHQMGFASSSVVRVGKAVPLPRMSHHGVGSHSVQVG